MKRYVMIGISFVFLVLSMAAVAVGASKKGMEKEHSLLLTNPSFT